jgi:tripartite ATP-independent transporter DctM subunit
MSETMIGLIGIALLMVMFLSGMELGFSMAMLGFLGFSYVVSPKAGLSLLAHDIFDASTSYSFTVVPVFMFMGMVAFNAGIARQLYLSAYRFFGHIPGGLAMATVGGATAFGSITGSPTATSATFASVAIPEMDRYNYDKRLSTGVVAASGCLGPLIPPSNPLIIYGIITEQSIGKLFTASLIPGLIVSLLFLFTVYGWCRINPSFGPKGERSSWRERMSSLRKSAPVVIIFIVVVGGLMLGLFTPTEAGGVGAFAVAVLCLIKREINWRGLVKSTIETLRSSSMVLVLIFGSIIFGHFIAVTKIPMAAADWISLLPLDRHLIVGLIALVYLVGGSFIDDLAFMVLATPIFYPVILKLGFDLVWFGVFLQIVVMIGVIIPPVAINVFIVKNIAKVPLSVVYAGTLPFLIGLAFCAFLILLFPQIALFLPSFLRL